ncbi:MAG: hypothetical protein P0Y53_20925 [Candidatus Pseudobacter hemicellulosilyticus]|uniref:Uncharacterized protein n=1 Tax=Candidatus Pseudobacter hemicellulosilyticus TaxID=3121375 RepID=A0AAJ5WQL5_9BACT|nr:MAG: hypothetical protein P0Y53_20925 [Pseudobacter sp.]
MNTLLLYSSRNNIERICSQLIGPQKEVQSTDANQSTKSFSLGLALGNLIYLITGVSVNGTYSAQNTVTSQTKLSYDSYDRVTILIDTLQTEPKLKYIQDIATHPSEVLYKFDLDVSLTELYKPNATGSFIRINHVSSDLIFEGLTSKENWAGDSIVNNILHAADGGHLFRLQGLCAPLKMEKKEGKIVLIVQFILLYNINQPSTNGLA